MNGFNFRAALITLLFLCMGVTGMSQTRVGLPDFYTFQYAGSIGMGSIGAAYYMPNGKSLVGLHYGFVPQYMGDEMNILTLKFIYQPWIIHINKTYQLNLLSPGAMVSYHIGKEFNVLWPDHPKGYYWWSPAIRPHLSIENSLNINFSKSLIQRAVLYLEANTNDLYLVSYALNTHSLRFHEVVKLGTGVRFHFRTTR